MHGPSRAATLLVLALFGVVALATTTAPAATVPAAKPKGKACKKGTLKVKTGKTTRCVKLRLAPPAPDRTPDNAKAALDLVLSTRWPTLKDRRGRTVRSPAREIARIRGAKAKVRAAVAKGLRLAAAKGTAAGSRKALGSPTARARAAQGGGSVTGVQEGSSIGFDAEVPAGDYRISIEFRTNDLHGRLNGKRCPTAAGLVENDLDARTRISIAITARGRTVMATSTEMADVAAYAGHMADDAYFETLDVDHSGSIASRVSGDGHGAVSLRLRAHRTAQVDMRSLRYTATARQLDVTADVEGAPPAVAAALEAQLASRLSAGTDDAFAGVVGRGMGEFAQMGFEIREPGRCAVLSFDPPADPSKSYKKGETGTFAAYVKPHVDPGNRAPGRFTVLKTNLVQVTPSTAAGTSPTFTFTVVDDTEGNGYANFRATSKAGVATGTRDIRVEVGAPRYKVTAFTYTDQLQLDHVTPFGGCTPSSSQGNTISILPTGLPEDGALSPPLPAPIGNGEQTGQIVARGKIQKQVAYTGCKLNDDGSAYVPCPQQNSGSEEWTLAIDLFVDAGFGDARLTWHPRIPSIGDVAPIISPCVVFGAQGTEPLTAVTTVPRAALFDAGPHTLFVEVPYEQQAGAGTLHSSAHYSVTIERL